MRLSEEKIKLGINHAERYVRDLAVSYFSMSFSGDRSVMPLATTAIEKYGFLDALSDIDALRNLAQSDPSVSWLTGEISRMGSSTDQRHWAYVGSLSWILAEADAGLLKRRRKEILDLRFLDPEARRSIEHRTRLLSVSPESCWNEFDECCRQLGAGGQTASVDVLARAYELLEAISHHPGKFSDRVLTTIAEEHREDHELSRRWTKACLIRAAGQMRLTAAVPHLIELLQVSNEDWVCEECVMALTRIGGDAVVKALWNACALAQVDFLEYAAWVLECIHSDLSEQAALHLFHAADHDPSTKIAFGHALLSDFTIDGITAVRNLVLQQAETEDMLELKSALLAVCTLAEADFPELNNWREQFRQEQTAHERWQTPEFPVVETWSPQITDPPPQRRSEPPDMLPLRIPKVQRYRGVGRNEPCPCESGKKFKNCCMRRN